MSLLVHKDRGQVLVVNREEKEASPPSYPLGVRRACACNRHPPKVVWTSLPSRLSSKCRSPGTGQNARHYLEQDVRDQQKVSATGSAQPLPVPARMSPQQRWGLGGEQLPPWPVSVCSGKIRVARPSWRGPVGCSSAASTRVAALHTRTSAIVDTPPVVEQERRLRVGVGHPRCSFKPEVPLAVGEVEEQCVGSRHLQVVFRDQAGVTRRPDGAVRRFDPEPARVLGLEHAVTRAGGLPCVVGRG
jgi:hypothetical protein